MIGVTQQGCCTLARYMRPLRVARFLSVPCSSSIGAIDNYRATLFALHGPTTRLPVNDIFCERRGALKGYVHRNTCLGPTLPPFVLHLLPSDARLRAAGAPDP